LGDRKLQKPTNSAAALAHSLALRWPISVLSFLVGFISFGRELAFQSFFFSGKLATSILTWFGKLATPLLLGILFCPTSELSHDRGWRAACACRMRDSYGRCAVASG